MSYKRTVVRIVMHMPRSDLELEAHYLLKEVKAKVRSSFGRDRDVPSELPGGARAWKDTLSVKQLNDSRFVFEIDWVGDEPPPAEALNFDGNLVPVMDILRYEAEPPKRAAASYHGIGRRSE